MFLGNARKITVILVLVFLVISVLLTGCWGKKKALSLDEILNSDVEVPIYYLDPSSGYKDLKVVYYYSEDSEVQLSTYFLTENLNSQTVRVAVLFTCRACGGLVDGSELHGDAPVPVAWAQGLTGACKVLNYNFNLYLGDMFKSCLYWYDQNAFSYKFYSVWSEEESVDFVNSLTRVLE